MEPKKKRYSESLLEIKHFLSPVIPFIRFSLMTSDFFLKDVYPFNFLPSRENSAMLEFLSHESIPDRVSLRNVKCDPPRKCGNLGFYDVLAFEQYELPSSKPLIVWKGGLYYLSGELRGGDGVHFKGEESVSGVLCFGSTFDINFLSIFEDSFHFDVRLFSLGDFCGELIRIVVEYSGGKYDMANVYLKIDRNFFLFMI